MLPQVEWRWAGVRMAAVKTAVEQFVYWSYFSHAYHHVVIGALKGLAPLDCLHILAATFWPTMAAHWALWVPVQFLNFHYTPVRHQLAVMLGVSLVWTTTLAAQLPLEAQAAPGWN